MPPVNPNTLWATLFVEALAHNGLTAVCIAPGSRSTPLTLACHAHPHIDVHRHLDERSAAFFALGLAAATNTPVALVCTSGTATINFHPAIVEAYMSHIPLLILTADRPPELRHSGANQTIDQVKMYGDHVLWAVDVPLPEANAPTVALRNLQSLAARALATANGLRPGPVHLNFPFRKPLEPNPFTIHNSQFTIHNSLSPIPTLHHGTLTLTPTQLDHLATLIHQNPRGLIICGPRCPNGDFPPAVAALSRQSGYPIFADPLSGLRFGNWVTNTAVIGGYDTFLMENGPDWPTPDIILRFGAVPVSKSLNHYLDTITPTHRWHIRENGIWADDGHRTTTFYQANETHTCQQLSQRLPPLTSDSWQTRLMSTEKASWHAISAALLKSNFFDGAIVADILTQLPPQAHLFVGNSLPIRHVDQFGQPRHHRLHLYGNRGASGIDGITSCAFGVAAATDQPTILIVGDVSFYHDLNGLQIAQTLSKNITIILLNNNGGHIFRRLPIAQFEPPFTDLFLTPHHLDFEPVIRMYGLTYQQANSRDALKNALSMALTQPTANVIEVKTNGRIDHQQRQQLIQTVLTSINKH